MAERQKVPPEVSERTKRFWSYLSEKELDYFPSTKVRWFLLMVLIFAWTVEQFERAKMGPVLIFLLEDFNVQLSTWGNFTALGTVLGILAAYIASNLADRFGRKALIFWPITIYIFIAAGIAIAPNFSTVITLNIVGIIVASAMFPVVQAAVRDVSPRMGRAFAYSWLSLAFVLGALSSNWAGALIIPVWPGWRPQFWVAAGVALVTAVIVGVFYKNMSEKFRSKIISEETGQLKKATEAAGYANITEARQSGNLVYKDWRIWMLGLALMFWVVLYASIGAYMPLYFTEYFNMDPATAASSANVFWLVFMFSVFLSGWISDKLQVRKIVTVFGGITTGITFIVLALLPSTVPMTLLLVLWAVAGLFSGFIYPAWCALLSENAENISPFGVARAFGIAAILQGMIGVLMHMGLPVVVANWGWPMWILISGISCFLLAVCTSFGRGPWWTSRADRKSIAS